VKAKGGVRLLKPRNSTQEVESRRASFKKLGSESVELYTNMHGRYKEGFLSPG